MPLLRINATSAGLRLHEGRGTVAGAIQAEDASTGPAIVMLHGYKYAPFSLDHCPHRKLFGTEPHKWPAQLGFTGRASGQGLGIALGWYARGPLRAVHGRAAALGEHLATLVTLLRAQAPCRPVHIIAHSLGTEMALNALGHLPPGSIDRMVLLTGASFSSRAQDMLDTPAGRSVSVLNVTSRENDLFDAAFERFVSSALPGDRAIGQGIAGDTVVNLQLDCPKTLSILRCFGFPVAAPERRICHWSSYRRDGVMSLYESFLRGRAGLSVDRLLKALPGETDPRWSRLFAMPRIPAPACPGIRRHLSAGPGSMGRMAAVFTQRREESEPA